MDEITLLESSLPDAPPPAPEVVARARARLTAQEVRHRPRRTWTLIIGAATATAAVVTAAALAASLLAHAPAPVSAPCRPRRRRRRGAARDCFLELADRVERLPVETGAYWRTRILRRHSVLAGTASAHYLIANTLDTNEWIPADPGALPVHEAQWEAFEP